MDIFVYNVPSHASQKQITQCFAEPLAECGITVYHCQVPSGKTYAFITVHDAKAGDYFLSIYGEPPPQQLPAQQRYLPQRPFQQRPPQQRSVKRVMFHNRTHLRCKKSDNTPSDLSIQALVYEEAKLAATAVGNKSSGNQDKASKRFTVLGLHCGSWTYDEKSRLTFDVQFTRSAVGTMTFGRQDAVLVLGAEGGPQTRMDLSYPACEHILFGDYQDPSITFSLIHSPKFYKVGARDELVTNLLAMSLGPTVPRKSAFAKSRITGIDALHSKVAGACRVYRVNLRDFSELSRARTLIQSSAKDSSPLSYSTRMHYPVQNYSRIFTMLQTQISDTGRFGSLPFPIRFQLERLARNGILSPGKVMDLLAEVSQLYNQKGTDATAHALRRMCSQLPSPGPDVLASELALPGLKEMLVELAESYDRYAPGDPYELSRRFQHINLVHRIVITPTGTYLEGPEPEPTNRVLRRYAEHIEYFVRVVFQDEDGGSVRYDSRASQFAIYHERFKSVLDGVVLVAGRGFSFLGFSHSSLRSQACWFMAPLVRDGRMAYAPQILKELGDFSHIRTPAKCAARIGQNFTDTNSTVDLDPKNVLMIPTVERNDRDFSDGVGTISSETLARIWRVYGTKRALKPTALQIRFQGSKGMVSLDSRLRGEALRLRSSMKKFDTESSWNLEICGAAFKPLPMVLNRQFIKIMEDLGIATDVFLDLQTAATARLRMMTQSAVNTASFLDEVSISRATQMPSMMTLLGEVGLDYHTDSFLYSVVEMAVVTSLRELKYRARLPVPEGLTLYGIMDETGILNEGEIFVITERQPSSVSRKRGVVLQPGVEGGKQVLVKNDVVVTRSPAMHPGDIQLAHAVDVPADSPLQQLRNVVVFSQHGNRDLPSQLSGGDLDGDLYNIIFDDRLIPDNTWVAADYPRVPPLELDRDVAAKDMSDFFVTFIETDNLGMICNLHQQLADQSGLGVLDPKCRTLANMASTAVDYSKTGRPVNMDEMPKHQRIRPDFMAPSPRLIVSERGALETEEVDDGDDDAFEGLDAERTPMRYYRSEKTLGKLYRNIDENQFLLEMQNTHRLAITGTDAGRGFLDKMCGYMKWHAKQFGVLYDNYMDLARDIRFNYDDSIIDILYTYSPSPHMPLAETEVFSGTILGRQGGVQGKPLRELSKTMRERFEVICDYAVLRIVQGDEAMADAEYLDALYDLEEREIEALPRAIACLLVAVNERGVSDRCLGELKSFRYVAAGVCLRELQRWQRSLGQYGFLPKFKESMMQV